ncbi:hypothetical protein [Pseudomonas brassicacearum]
MQRRTWPSAPSTRFMESVESNLTQRMLNELSPSPIPATGGLIGMPGVCA